MSQQVSLNRTTHPLVTLPEQPEAAYGQPHLIFSTELDGTALSHVLLHGQVLETLIVHKYGLALAMLDLSEPRAQVVRHLNACGIYTVAWLLLSPDEGYSFNLQNYPQAIEQYTLFRNWACTHDLHFDAIGLDIEPPASEVTSIQHWGLRDIARRLWLAHENVLYPAARAAYSDLITRIHADGYEVHTYQLPLVADDRRAGTTLIQRAMDVVDLPADLEVLLCYSSLPIESLGNDLGGTLITSYGTAADSIGVGSTSVYSDKTDSSGQVVPALTWEALERDMLLAARYTDTIYISSLEGCVERNLLPRIVEMDWNAEPVLPFRRRIFIDTLRSVLLAVLLIARFYRRLFAWLGWIIALVLLVQRWRQRWERYMRRQQ